MATAERVTRSKRDREDEMVEDTAVKKQCLEVDGEEIERRCSFSTPSVINKFSGGKNGLNSGRRERPGEKPAELFRKDLISAMKLPDSEPLQQDEYFTIQDPWRQEWERGVQVPVNTHNIPLAAVRVIAENVHLHGSYGFKLNPRKFLHATKDDQYQQSIHEIHETQKLSEQMCRYDLDELDVAWLETYNEQRTATGRAPLEEWLLEKIMESLENQCYSNMQTMIKTVEGLGIEYDENVVCDVCRSPDSEDNNEMVFCDSCDICVHQACYGIQKIPEGSWLCRVCALGVHPKCILCPRLGGAMKSTKSGSKWAHVSCSLWIPEVNIGCPEKMEPITKISQIPSSRWSLVCSICRERAGACIQCCVKTCKTAFHVTCAFHHNLDMKTILDEDGEDVSLKAYCMKHTKRKDGDITPRKSDAPFLPPTPKKESEMTEEEKTELRSHRLKKLAEEFYLCVKPGEVANNLHLDEEMVDFVHAYWVLKRRANFNKPLLMPKTEEADLLSKQREDTLLARMKMFIHLRQDLERVRNLCYMVSRREKIRKQVYKLKEQIFHKQVAVVRADKNFRPNMREYKGIACAHKATNTLYDQPDAVLNAARLLEKQVREETTTSVALSSDQEADCKPASDKKKIIGAGNRARNARLAREAKRRHMEQQQVLQADVYEDSDSMSDSGKTDESFTEGWQQGAGKTAKRKLCLEVDSGGKSPQASSVQSGTWGSVSCPVYDDPSETDEPSICLDHQLPEKTLHQIDESESHNTARSRPNIILQDSNADENLNLTQEPRRSLRSNRVSESSTPLELEQVQNAASPNTREATKCLARPQRSAFSFIENEICDLRKQQQRLSVTAKPETAGSNEAVQESVKPNSEDDAKVPHDSDLKTLPALAVKLRDRQKSNISTISGRRNSSKDHNGRYPKSSLIVSEEIKQRVQNRLRRRQNGLHNSRRFLTSCFSRNRMPSLGRKDMGLQTNNTPSIHLADGKESLKDVLGATSIKKSSGYKLPGKSATLTENSVIKNVCGFSSNQGLNLPETRSVRRKIESDLESNASDKLFESVDREVSIRSREATPEPDTADITLRNSRLHSNKLAINRRLQKKLKGNDSDSDGENAFVNVLDSDDDYVPSDSLSERSATAGRRKSTRRKVPNDLLDENSRDSLVSFDR